MKSVGKIVLAGVILMVLAVGGCMALLSGAAKEIDKELDKEAANDKPSLVTEGKAFEHDNFKAAAGWKVAKEEFGGVTIEGLKVTNESDEGRTAWLTFSFYKGTEVLAEVNCNSNEIQGGESTVIDCGSLESDFPTGYDAIKVADAI